MLKRRKIVLSTFLLLSFLFLVALNVFINGHNLDATFQSFKSNYVNKEYAVSGQTGDLLYDENENEGKAGLDVVAIYLPFKLCSLKNEVHTFVSSRFLNFTTSYTESIYLLFNNFRI